MICSFADGTTRRLFEDGRRRGFRGLDYERALDAANDLESLRGLRAVRLNALFANHRGRFAMAINGRWRITFAFRDGNAREVKIEDYHRG